RSSSIIWRTYVIGHSLLRKSAADCRSSSCSSLNPKSMSVPLSNRICGQQQITRKKKRQGEQTPRLFLSTVLDRKRTTYSPESSRNPRSQGRPDCEQDRPQRLSLGERRLCSIDVATLRRSCGCR